MNIHIEGFDQNNNYIFNTLQIDSPLIKDTGMFSFYDWYKDGEQLNPYEDILEDNQTYEVIYNKENINLTIQINNKKFITPLINKNIKIKELKNILSIKDNIYFNKIKLNDNRTLDSYNINNMDRLNTQSSLSIDYC
jgi:hypothetical protein